METLIRFKLLTSTIESLDNAPVVYEFSGYHATEVERESCIFPMQTLENYNNCWVELNNENFNSFVSFLEEEIENNEKFLNRTKKEILDFKDLLVRASDVKIYERIKSDMYESESTYNQTEDELAEWKDILDNLNHLKYIESLNENSKLFVITLS